MNKENNFKDKIRLFGKIFTRVPYLKARLWIIIPLVLTGVWLSSVQPYFYKLLIDKIELSINSHRWFNEMLPELITTSIYLIIAVCALLLISFFRRLYLAKFIYIDWKNYLIEVASNFLDVGVSYHTSKNVWEKTKIFDRWSSWLFWWSFHFFNIYLPQTLVIFTLFMLGMYINIKMTIFSFLLLPITVSLVFFIWFYVMKKQDKVQDLWDKVFSRFSDSMTNINIIKIFVKEKKEIEILSNNLDVAIEKQFKVEYLWAIFINFLSALNMIWQVSSMIFGTYLVIVWDMTLWVLFMFIAINNQIYSSIWEIFWNLESLTSNINHFWKAESIIAMEKEYNKWKISDFSFKKSITFKGIWFKYPETDREVIKWIDLEIAKWNKVALVWHTWSWKTTISSLLSRFYLPTTWTIEVDWLDINSIELHSYRSKIAQVFQDNTLFNDTILHNLQYIKSDATLEEIKDACKKAQILDFIESLENGFETVVWERWLKLSWWEKQRLAIARAILSDPEILILDEATSALDSKTEHDIKETFENLMKWRTSVIIAHRLSTIQKADVIYVIDKWAVVAKWTHEELLINSLHYKELVSFQRGDFLDE